MTATVYRYKAALGGWQGAPGVTLWHIRFGIGTVTNEDVQNTGTQIRGFYQSLISYFLNGMTVQIEPDVDIFTDTTGEITGTEVISQSVVTNAGSGNQLSRATMAVSRMVTDKYIGGRNLRGRHFLGPLATNALNTSGQLETAFKSAVVAAYDPLLDVASGRVVIWHRPSSSGASDGDTGFVQNVSMMPAPGVLRSRRD